MAANEATEKLFDAINESSDAMIDAVRAASDRGHRFSAAVIEQAQESQREAVELTRKWIDAPLDFLGLLTSMTETTTKAQGRALDSTRQWFDEMGEAQKESREVIQRVVNANRAAGEATVELTRGIFTRANEAVQSATVGNGRKAAKTTAAVTKSADSSADEA
ncbi:MAG: hypothetical protein IH866_03000 [Chloroflexi bacterium]|nr:hypothetical protein [Chloroflexota bacterium]